MFHHLDFLWSPLLHKLEQSVAGQQIPSVHNLPNRKTMEDAANTPGESFDHSLWNGLLEDYVDTSPGNAVNEVVTGVNLVDYDGISNDQRFPKYLDALGKASDPNTTLSGSEQLAFWMNAYNALCVNLVVTHQPSKSINDLTTKEQKVWNREAGTVAGQPVSLNHIEHEQLRKVWAVPEVHACIVCASGSCPNLRPEAYSGNPELLKEQFRNQMSTWMQNETKGLRLVSPHRLVISRIFLWFENDFGPEGVAEFLLPYVADEAIRKALQSNQTSIRYFGYDWNLNRKL